MRFSHTIFAMPFALGAMLVAANGLPGWKLTGLIVLSMVFARTAAMSFNRIVDWEIDKRNPRTEGRHRLLNRNTAIALLIISSTAFVCTTFAINRICFYLSPVALVIIFFYSLTKRFTSWSHFFLGLALAAAPVGAWLAVTGSFAWAPLVMAAGVLLWVAGFDMIYATMDYEFDVKEGLNSMVVRLGVDKSLRIAQLLHWLMLPLFLVFGWLAGLGLGYAIAMVIVVGMLIYEHRCAKRRDTGSINQAFFVSNAIVGVAFVAGIAVDLLLL